MKRSSFYKFLNTAPGINAIPREENLRYFDALMTGPIQSPFEGL
ncbi:18244_t:CDS:2 [Entrophospora sp. SA101]|nr:18244_t:CDS:2 [Entrophospora sp. SA101]